jgi:hypothetical protein
LQDRFVVKEKELMQGVDDIISADAKTYTPKDMEVSTTV